MLDDIRLVLCDIDGTLLTSDGNISFKTKETIKKLKNKNILFGIATGRPVCAIEKFVKEWGLQNSVDFIIGLNGGHCLNVKTNKVSKNCLMDGKYIIDILDNFKDFEKNVGLFDGREFHAIKANDYAANIAKGDGVKFVVDDLTSYHTQYIEKLVFMAEPHVVNQIEEFYQKHIHTTHYRAVRSASFLFEFTHLELSKLKGIENICNDLGISLNQVLTFGDELNDFEMIQNCVGVAMGNANPKLQEVAKFITLSHDEDGIGVFLEEHIL